MTPDGKFYVNEVTGEGDETLVEDLRGSGCFLHNWKGFGPFAESELKKFDIIAWTQRVVFHEVLITEMPEKSWALKVNNEWRCMGDRYSYATFGRKRDCYSFRQTEDDHTECKFWKTSGECTCEAAHELRKKLDEKIGKQEHSNVRICDGKFHCSGTTWSPNSQSCPYATFDERGICIFKYTDVVNAIDDHNNRVECNVHYCSNADAIRDPDTKDGHKMV